MLFSLLTLPGLVAGFPNLESRVDDALHLPLARNTIHRRDGPVDLSRIASSAESIRRKYGFKSADAGGLVRRGSQADLEVLNQVWLDQVYCLSMSLLVAAYAGW